MISPQVSWISGLCRYHCNIVKNFKVHRSCNNAQFKTQNIQALQSADKYMEDLYVKNFQHREWIGKLCAFSCIRCVHWSSIHSIPSVPIALCIFLSFMINCSCLNRSSQMKDEPTVIKQSGEPDKTGASVRKKGGMSVVRDHSNHRSFSSERLLDVKKEKTDTWTHQLFDYVDLKRFHQKIKTRLPKYEKIIKQEASKHGLDWTLIAAVIYQESHFNPTARSYTGVRGLMQLTLPTARELGVKNRLDPVQSIQGGVKYLKKLWARFEDIHGPDRMLFTLASYNIGYGHVRDAQMLAQLQGLDMKRWASVEQCLPLLMDEAYYPQTKHGYARGKEPVHYVKRIIAYYDILRKITYG